MTGSDDTILLFYGGRNVKLDGETRNRPDPRPIIACCRQDRAWCRGCWGGGTCKCQSWQLCLWKEETVLDPFLGCLSCKRNSCNQHVLFTSTESILSSYWSMPHQAEKVKKKIWHARLCVMKHPRRQITGLWLCHTKRGEDACLSVWTIVIGHKCVLQSDPGPKSS